MVCILLTCIALGTWSLAKPTIACIGMLAILLLLPSKVEVSPLTESISWADISSGGPGSEMESREERKQRKENQILPHLNTRAERNKGKRIKFYHV